jgi:hypothetical protein
MYFSFLGSVCLKTFIRGSLKIFGCERLWESKPVTFFRELFCRLSHFSRVSDLLASFDKFLVAEPRTAALPYVRFEWHEVGQSHHRRQVCSFLKAWICLLTCIAVTVCLRKCIAIPSTLEGNSFHVWGPNSVSGNRFLLKIPYVIGLCWLHNDFG